MSVKEPKYFNRVVHLIRSFVYSACLAFVFLLLINVHGLQNSNLFGEVAFIGFFLAVVEAYFTTKYVNEPRDQKKFNYSISEHLINHLFYPFVTFFALCFYLLLQTNFTLSYVLVGVSFLIFFIYFYYLPIHLHYDHFDHAHAKHIHPKIEFMLHLFKFFSYFVVNLAIFTYYFQTKISFETVVLLNFLTNFLYLFFHIYRKKDLRFVNIFMAFMFSIITCFFTLTFKASVVNLSASVATLFFYLTSAIFYHKVDGSFNYRVMIEYGSIALIISVLLFSIR